MSYTNCSLFGPESSVLPGDCTTGRWMKDRGQWQYLGGWSILQKHFKDDSLRSLSHVWGSPMSLGLADATERGLTSIRLESHKGQCFSAGHLGRVKFTTSADWQLWSALIGNSDWHRERADWQPLAVWQPLGCKLSTYVPEDFSLCLQHRNVTRIVFAGDSLVREQYAALSWFAGKAASDYFTWDRPDGIPVKIEYKFFPTMVFDFEEETKSDIFITNFDVHWHAWLKSRDEALGLIDRFVSDLWMPHSRHWRIYMSSVFVHSLRQRYIQPSKLEWLNAEISERLAHKGFQLLDIYNLTKLTGNLTEDGMHLGRFASIATPLLLNLICETPGTL